MNMPDFLRGGAGNAGNFLGVLSVPAGNICQLSFFTKLISPDRSIYTSLMPSSESD